MKHTIIWILTERRLRHIYLMNVPFVINILRQYHSLVIFVSECSGELFLRRVLLHIRKHYVEVCFLF